MYKIKVEYIVSHEEKLGVMFGAMIRVIDYDVDLDTIVLPKFLDNLMTDSSILSSEVITPKFKRLNILVDFIKDKYMKSVKKIIVGRRSESFSNTTLPNSEIFEL